MRELWAKGGGLAQNKLAKSSTDFAYHCWQEKGHR